MWAELRRRLQQVGEISPTCRCVSALRWSHNGSTKKGQALSCLARWAYRKVGRVPTWGAAGPTWDGRWPMTVAARKWATQASSEAKEVAREAVASRGWSDLLPE